MAKTRRGDPITPDEAQILDYLIEHGEVYADAIMELLGDENMRKAAGRLSRLRTKGYAKSRLLEHGYRQWSTTDEGRREAIKPVSWAWEG